MCISWERDPLIQPLRWCSTPLHSNFCSCLLPHKQLYRSWKLSNNMSLNVVKVTELVTAKRHAHEVAIDTELHYLIIIITSVGRYAHTREIFESSYTWLHWLCLWAFNDSNSRSLMFMSVMQNHSEKKFIQACVNKRMK